MTSPKRLGELVRQGVLLQVTASTLASPKRRTHAFARGLVREGLAHVIASDSHGAGLDRAGLAAGVAALAEVAPRRARWMVTEAPAAILAGAPLPPPPRDRARRRAPGRAAKVWRHGGTAPRHGVHPDVRPHALARRGDRERARADVHRLPARDPRRRDPRPGRARRRRGATTTRASS